MKTSSRMPQTGFSLVEVIAGIILTVSLSATVWNVATPTGTMADVSHEASRLSALNQSIDRAFAGNKNFAGVSTANELRDGWFPNGFDVNNSPWGPFDILPAQTVQPADSWMAIYQGVTTEACNKLAATELSTGKWSAIAVGGKPVTAATLIDVCSDPTTASPTGGYELTFTHYTGPRTGGNSGLQPICFDHTREQVIADGAPAGCTTDPMAYAPASHA
jgi:type II secretory pathway pseudopilin PulG